MKRVTMLLAAGLVLLAATSLPIIRASAQQAVVTDDNLQQMIANAKTSADHGAIAAYYDKEAAEAEAKAKLHHETFNNYMRFRNPPWMAQHCADLANAFDRAAVEDKTLAEEHREMAKNTGAGT